MPQDSKQRIVDFASGAQSQSGWCCIFLKFRQLRLELSLFRIQFAFLVEAAQQFVLSQTAFALALLRQIAGLFKLTASCSAACRLIRPIANCDGEADQNHRQHINGAGRLQTAGS